MIYCYIMSTLFATYVPYIFPKSHGFLTTSAQALGNLVSGDDDMAQQRMLWAAEVPWIIGRDPFLSIHIGYIAAQITMTSRGDRNP